MPVDIRYGYVGNGLQCGNAALLASHSCADRSVFSKTFFLLALVLISKMVSAASYTVATKTDLQNRMNAALPGDTVVVANGTYNWGQILFTNNNSTSSSAWIVLKAQTFKGVKFTASTYLHFKGTRVVIDGFVFAEGSVGTNPVISFRSSSSNLSNYCRVTNIIIDNYNTYSADSSVENEWIGIYGTNNRVDHCTFINKYNAKATVIVWYANTAYPAPAPSTFHRIDSNYFKGRSYMGDNGGETIRIGTSTSSRTDGYNLIEYNLFENCTQNEPEIISNKSDFNTYRYNTFKNCRGGLTLRHGRYCNVYGNFFIVDDPSVTEAYGIRVIDKGHKIYNNYIEAVNGNASGGSSQLRAPINLFNGESADTTDAAAAAGYFAADSCIVAFNTIVNAKGGGGMVLGGTSGGTIQPTGIILANNLVKMTSGSALYKNSANTSLTFYAEGNLYNAPSGIGVTATGWTNAILNFGARVNGTLTPPSNVIDAAVNSNSYNTLLSSLDVKSKTRDAVFDVGAEELSSDANTLTYPLDSNKVGAGKPSSSLLPVRLLDFTAKKNEGKVRLTWTTVEENGIAHYSIQHSSGNNFAIADKVNSGRSYYEYLYSGPLYPVNYFRLAMHEKDGSVHYSAVRKIEVDISAEVSIYPNPSSGELFINAAKDLQVDILDATGRTLQTGQVSSNHALTVRSLLPGTYFLRVKQTGVVKTFIIIP